MFVTCVCEQHLCVCEMAGEAPCVSHTYMYDPLCPRLCLRLERRVCVSVRHLCVSGALGVHLLHTTKGVRSILPERHYVTRLSTYEACV